MRAERWKETGKREKRKAVRAASQSGGQGRGGGGGDEVMIDMRAEEEGMVRDDAAAAADHEQRGERASAGGSLFSDCSSHVVKFTIISLTVTSRIRSRGVDAWRRSDAASDASSSTLKLMYKYEGS